MKIESVDFFYLSMPHVRDIGDGSQDALLVRVRAGAHTGWGECEASPLVCIANWVCPMSHSACKPVRDSVLGQTLESPEDIRWIGHLVRASGLDIAQTDHTFSGVEIALWDLLGRKREQPVYQLLGYKKAYPKVPYASQLFGDSPDETLAKARQSRRRGFRAVKFGWGPYGHTTPADDRDQIAAAREGLGNDGILLVDAGTVWVDDVEQAGSRLAALREHRALWLEEPFISYALSAYGELARLASPLKLAGGEGAHNFHMAKQLIDHGGIGFVQIDTGRIGGIAPAKAVADYARGKGVTYVNHTFTTHLALAASIAPYAGVEEAEICEYPVEPSALARDLSADAIPIDPDGTVRLIESPGLGIIPPADVIDQYLVPVEIQVSGKVSFPTNSI